MSPRLPIPAEDLIRWKFQVEHQGFVVRYGMSGGLSFKQVVLQHGKKTYDLYPVKRVSTSAYNLAKRIKAIF